VGGNEIFSPCLHQKSRFANKEPAHEKVRARYQSMVDELRLDPRIRSEVVVFEVSSETATGNESEEEFAYLDDIHHYAGVLVIFRRG